MTFLSHFINRFRNNENKIRLYDLEINFKILKLKKNKKCGIIIY